MSHIMSYTCHHCFLDAQSLPSRRLAIMYKSSERKHMLKYKWSRIETDHVTVLSAGTHFYAFFAFFAFMAFLGAGAAAAAFFIAFFAILWSTVDPEKRGRECNCHSRQPSLNQSLRGKHCNTMHSMRAVISSIATISKSVSGMHVQQNNHCGP